MWRNLFAFLEKIRPAWALLGVIGLATALRLWQLDLLPPGLFFDEAYNGFDTRQILSGSNRPLFFAGNNGREPLFIYLQALSVAAFGATPYALRLVSALVGILTIPIIYFSAFVILKSAHSSFDGDRRAAWLALVAAVGMTISYWHLGLSRLGFRANLLIPISALTVAFFWRAWTGQRYRDYFWTGVWLALAMYTYLAARFLPLVLLAFVAVEMVIAWGAHRGHHRELWPIWKLRWRGLALLAAVTCLGVLPLAWTLLNDPTLLSARTSQVPIWAMLPTDQPAALLEALLANLYKVARAFYDQGDLNLRHNLPGRPVNDPLLALLFTAGWLSALWQIRQPRFRLLLFWLAIMLAPTVLSTEAPHYLRGAGALPPMAILYAVGAGTITDALGKAAPLGSRPSRAHTLRHGGILVVLLLILGFSGRATAIDYFFRWAKHPGLGQAFDVDLQLAAEQTATHLQDAQLTEALLVSKHLYLQPHMGFVLGPVLASNALPTGGNDSSSTQMLQEESFDSRASVIALWKDKGQILSSWLEPLDPSVSQASLQPRALRWPTHQPGWPQIAEISLPNTTDLQPRRIRYPLDVTFANDLRLVGYDVEPDVLAPIDGSAALRLTLFWQDRTPGEKQPASAQGEFDVFAHLNVGGAVVQTNNGVLRQLDLLPYLQAGGTTVDDVRLLTPPAQTPSGRAHFEVGLYRFRPNNQASANDRIAIVNQEGQAVADRIDLGAVWIGEPPVAAGLADLPTVGVEFDGRIELVGVRVADDPAMPERLLVELGWRATDRSTVDYHAFVHLLDAAGQMVSQHDAPPGGSANPTSLWAPDETIRSVFPLELPPGAHENPVSLRIGLYEPISGKQLAVSAASDTSGDTSGGAYVVIPFQAIHGTINP
jgi:hypothetical protein